MWINCCSSAGGMIIAAHRFAAVYIDEYPSALWYIIRHCHTICWYAHAHIEMDATYFHRPLIIWIPTMRWIQLTLKSLNYHLWLIDMDCISVLVEIWRYKYIIHKWGTPNGWLISWKIPIWSGWFGETPISGTPRKYLILVNEQNYGNSPS